MGKGGPDCGGVALVFLNVQIAVFALVDGFCGAVLDAAQVGQEAPGQRAPPDAEMLDCSAKEG
jgi:hypothetical protein